MITITARINVSESSGGTIKSADSNLSGNNVSADIKHILGKRSVNIGNPFILGLSKLDSGATYADNLPYFIGAQLSDSNGNFAQSYKITISGSDISTAIIVFDTENNRHPNTLIVDGEVVYDDDPQFELAFANASDTHTIEIRNWNTANAPLIITSIYADVNIDINKNNLIAFNSDILDRANVQYPSFGIISNSASLTFADFNEQVLDLITQQILHSGIKVEVWLNNDISNTQEQVCLMETRELSYDNDNRQVQVSLKDNLEEWQDINIEPVNYNPLKPQSQTAEFFFNYLYSQTPNKYSMLSFDKLDEETQNILSNTTIEYPVLENGSLWDSWQKLCELCMLHIYVDYEGKTVVKYNNGN